MACLACVRACSESFYKEFDPDKSCIQIVEKKSVRPMVCPQCGKCAEACPEGAITQNPKGVYMINKKKCTGCGRCAEACPQQIIHIHEDANFIAVKCFNHDKGAASRKQCDVSCIGCGICEKTCTASAIHVIDNCAVIEEKYCLSCGMCAVKCPRHAIYDLRGVLTLTR